MQQECREDVSQCSEDGLTNLLAVLTCIDPLTSICFPLSKTTNVCFPSQLQYFFASSGMISALALAQATIPGSVCILCVVVEIFEKVPPVAVRFWVEVDDDVCVCGDHVVQV
jgi:hypothetical protein